jgi:hypothetical protein
MLTAKLEQLILQGKAFFRTAVIGGTQKATINIDDDRFIIITDVIYFPGYYVADPTTLPDEEKDFSSQFMIYGRRGYNNFIARTSFDQITRTLQGRSVYTPKNHIRYDLYLLHEKQVGFSFTKGADLTPSNFVAPADNPGYAPPMDYGRDGDTGALPTSIVTPITTPTGRSVINTSRPSPGSNNVNTLILPVDGQTRILATEMHLTQNYPILHVNYVEVIGQPNNIGI